VIRLPPHRCQTRARGDEESTSGALQVASRGPAADAGVAATGRGFPGFTLSHNVRSEAEVDTLLQEVAAGGATIVKPARAADWGGYSGYFADPDGFLWEVAFNPHFPIADPPGTA
jgi:uncharacterized glyoxalase superfamily protein PhnB